MEWAQSSSPVFLRATYGRAAPLVGSRRQTERMREFSGSARLGLSRVICRQEDGMVSPLVAKVTYVPPFGLRGNHPGGGCSGRTCAKLTHTATPLKTVLIRTNTDARVHLHVRKSGFRECASRWFRYVHWRERELGPHRRERPCWIQYQHSLHSPRVFCSESDTYFMGHPASEIAHVRVIRAPPHDRSLWQEMENTASLRLNLS